MNDSTNDSASGVAAAKMGHLREPGPEYRPLEILIGRWMTVGETVATADAPANKIYASDVYEWVPGGFFILHTAYGTIGNLGMGGIEMIGYDSNKKQFHTHFFDSQGNRFRGIRVPVIRKLAKEYQGLTIAETASDRMPRGCYGQEERSNHRRRSRAH